MRPSRPVLSTRAAGVRGGTAQQTSRKKSVLNRASEGNFARPYWACGSLKLPAIGAAKAGRVGPP